MTEMYSSIVAAPTSAGRSLVWCISAFGEIFSVTSSGVVKNAGFPSAWIGRRIDVEPRGRVWVLASHRHTGELFLHLRDAQTATWRVVCRVSEVTELAAGNGGVWLLTRDRLDLLNEAGNLQRTHYLPFLAQDVSESSDGSLWVVAGQGRLGGRSLYRLLPVTEQWSELPHPIAAIQVSCAPDGTAWTTNSKGHVWRIHPDGPGHFKECLEHADCRGCLKSPSTESVEEVSVGIDGEIWCRIGSVREGETRIARLLPRTARLLVLPGPVRAIRIAAGVMST